ncbi:serine/threonine-protein kinase RIO3 [Hippoglossus hippoglossus]|uniref:serine/threonine-protein kinase RIO3 n=1 Tax=Hippoglossus hippoglossus TaxID=8267 RepID=UPI00148DB272|nr:serine/threonine-protein kinase RIO3 [Hippoglossus hippoglossus]XP_034999154.1 serine/threonine-protein kinase RIO3 [Hippoglossus stenolepis]
MDRTGVEAETRKSPWGSVTPAAPACSLADVMSEQLAKQLHEEDNTFPDLTQPGADLLSSDEASETTSDRMLAKMLQMQFDRECDDQLRREEKKFNGDSKVSISFENYRMVHQHEDSGSSEDEVDWQDTRDDPYRADKPQTTPRKGFTGKGKNITTKHDEVTCGRKNAARMDNFAPEIHVGDGLGMDLKLPNQVFNALKQHCYSEQRRSARLHEKKEHSTSEQAVDPRTRLLMYKMVNTGLLENINGCISTGKESVVFHANGGSLEEEPVPDEVVLKVFKTTLNEFRNRDRYIKDDYRFIDRFSKLNPRKIIRLWAEKEMHNLVRMKKAEIPCPEVVLLKKHILVMSFIGKDHIPAPKLKDAILGSEDMKNAYYQVLHMMQQLFQECNLVHADLSEYNMLWHEGKVWLIDVSQSVEPTHPHGLEFLFRDCRNVSTFFQKRGVSEAMSVYELFNIVTGLNIAVGAEDDAEFLAEIEALQKRNEDHVQRRGKKSFPIASEDVSPPSSPGAAD